MKKYNFFHQVWNPHERLSLNNRQRNRQCTFVERNNEARSFNHSCRANTIM